MSLQLNFLGVDFVIVAQIESRCHPIAVAEIKATRANQSDDIHQVIAQGYSTTTPNPFIYLFITSDGRYCDPSCSLIS